MYQNTPCNARFVRSISIKAAKLEIGVLRQEALLLRGRMEEEEGSSQKKCFYKYEMLPICCLKAVDNCWIL
ncbi:hypothetical protein [Microcoleus sp. D2_18a_D3]|uniref:hypothetical protein n=1 Tax=Microcoleus sp. D2_18a_D3 TaxID=3055330 RepID=UPI002FD2D67D